MCLFKQNWEYDNGQMQCSDFRGDLFFGQRNWDGQVVILGEPPFILLFSGCSLPLLSMIFGWKEMLEFFRKSQEPLAPEILHKLAENKQGSITLKAYMYTCWNHSVEVQRTFNVPNSRTTANQQPRNSLCSATFNSSQEGKPNYSVTISALTRNSSSKEKQAHNY